MIELLEMTNTEFEILDELYFVISHTELMSQLSIEAKEANVIIHSMFEKGWVRAFASPDNTTDYKKIDDNLLSNSYLLASKAGLKAHNS